YVVPTRFDVDRFTEIDRDTRIMRHSVAVSRGISAGDPGTQLDDGSSLPRIRSSGEKVIAVLISVLGAAALSEDGRGVARRGRIGAAFVTICRRAVTYEND